MRMPLQIANALPLAGMQLFTPDGASLDEAGVAGRTETLTWGAALAPAGNRSIHVITATTNAATAIAVPTSLIPGTRHVFIITNASGGAMGAVTWGAGYLMSPFVAPADTQSVAVEFVALANGTQLRQVGALSGSVPGSGGVFAPAWVPAGITINNALGDTAVITATTAAAWTVLAPSVDNIGQLLTIIVDANAGAPLGAPTFDPAYNLVGGPVLTGIANGDQVAISFRCMGAADWIEVARTPNAYQTLLANAVEGGVDGVGTSVDGALWLDNQVSGAGVGAGTLTNAPVAGDPAFWVPIEINGVSGFFPVWQ